MQSPDYLTSSLHPDSLSLEPVHRTNGWGLSGFIVSLAGLLLTCGLLCPLGLLLSLIGIFRPPRGWAIAGLVIGLVGSTLLAVLVAIGMFSMQIAGKLKEFPEEVQTVASMGTAMQRIEEARKARGHLPEPEEGQTLIEDIQDGWSRALRYERMHESHYELRSAGKDGQFGTPDDATWDNLESVTAPDVPPMVEKDE